MILKGRKLRLLSSSVRSKIYLISVNRYEKEGEKHLDILYKICTKYLTIHVLCTDKIFKFDKNNFNNIVIMGATCSVVANY